MKITKKRRKKKEKQKERKKKNSKNDYVLKYIHPKNYSYNCNVFEIP